MNIVIQSVISILKHNSLRERRENLIKEQKLSEMKKISGDLAANTDLLNKLNESIRKNKKKLDYSKEDFFYLKNQRDQIIGTINSYRQKIQELNKKKKDCFAQINKITRELSDSTQNSKKNEFHLEIDTDKSLSKADIIKNLQNQAKEIQYEINQFNSKVSESQSDLEQINPNYETLEKDYNSLLNIIKTDEIRVKQIKNELSNEMLEHEKFKEFNLSEFNSLRSKQEIDSEIEETTTELNNLIEKNNLFDSEDPENLSRVIKELSELNHLLNKDSKDLSISYADEEIMDCIEKFRRLEILYSDIEDLINKFLVEINLETNFQTSINQDFQKFYIQIIFLRSKKESLLFEDLTTPEKIFFVIIFYIAIKIILGTKNIIFSNLFVPNEYNKRGSIFRTISKILPIFEKQKELKNFNLIFIISNLEMKKKIENIKIIKIEEN